MEKKPHVISTLNPSSLLPIEQLARLSQSLAVLDAALMPEWEYRYYSCNARWREAEMMASMRNGSGDGYFIWFGQAGAVLKGFAHESAIWSYFHGQSDLAVSSLAQQIPAEFEPFLHEPAFALEELTFCLWRLSLAATWMAWQPPVPAEIRFSDGSAHLLALLDGNPRTYQQWADEYYEIRPKLAALRAVYAHQPLTEDLLKQLRSPRSQNELMQELEEIGYPAG